MVVGLATPFIPHFAWFVAARFVEGLLLAGLAAIAVTAIAETVHPRALGTAVGTYIAGTTIGGLVGRILAATAAEPSDWRWGMGAVALLGAPLVASPERTVVGSMEHGIGAAWFLELALVTMAAAVLRRERPRRFAWAAWSAGASVAACLLLQVLRLPYGGETFVPYDFREYSA